MIAFESSANCANINSALFVLSYTIIERRAHKYENVFNVGTCGTIQVVYRADTTRTEVRSFLSEGRGIYWRARAEDDAQFNDQLQNYERQNAASAQRNDELRQRYQELLADEAHKAQR